MEREQLFLKDMLTSVSEQVWETDGKLLLLVRGKLLFNLSLS